MQGYELYKYYKGEQKNPFDESELAALWWDGEKSFHEKATSDTTFIETVSNLLRSAIKNNAVSGTLINESVDFDKRALIYYLDIWHGKWYPYDDANLIFNYVAE